MSINRFLKNVNVCQIGKDKNPTAAFHSETKIPKTFFDQTKTIKKAKATKQPHAFKNYTQTYNVEILNSFYPELQLKNTESAIKNKLKKLLNKWKGFEFVITLALKF